MNKPKVIGLTGQTGAGKTTVSALWAEEPGVAVINADQVARDVVESEIQCLADLALAFSIEILNADGTLNRERLAAIVFGDKQKLKKLNSTIFPYILEELLRRIQALSGGENTLVVMDAPTLFESGADSLCDQVVSVIAPEELRRERILTRDGLTPEQADARMASQHVDEYYTGRSAHVIENDGDVAALRLRAAQVLEALLAPAAEALPVEG